MTTYLDATNTTKQRARKLVERFIRENPNTALAVFGQEGFEDLPAVVSFPAVDSTEGAESLLHRVGFRDLRPLPLFEPEPLPVPPNDGRKIFCLIVPWMALGGADRCGLDLLHHFKAKGWRTVVIATRHIAGDSERQAAFREAAGEVYLTPKAAQVLARLQPEVIVVNNSHEAYAERFDLRNASPGSLLVSLFHMLLPAPWDFENALRTASPFDLVLTVSEKLRLELLEREVSPRVETLHWFGFPGDSKRTRKRQPKGRKTILCPFRLDTQKRPEFVVSIARSLSTLRKRSEMPTFLIVGDGRLRQSTEAKVEELRLSPFFEFRSGVSFEGMPALFESSDALLCPSLDEGIPLAYFEAMQYALPLAVSDVGAVSELVPPAFLVPLLCENEAERYAAMLNAHLNGESEADARKGQRLIGRKFSGKIWGGKVDALLTPTTK